MQDASKTELHGSEYLDIVNEINDFIASLDAPPLDNHTHKLVGNASSSRSSAASSVSAVSASSSGRKKTFGNHGDDDDPPESWEGLRSRHRSGDEENSNGASSSSTADGTSGGGSDVLGLDAVGDSNVCGGYDEGLDESSLSFEQDLGDYDNSGSDDVVGGFPVLPTDKEQTPVVDPFATYDYVDNVRGGGGGGGGSGVSGLSSAGTRINDVATVDYADVSSDCSNTSSGGSYSIYSDGSVGSNSSSCDAADSDSGCYSYSQCGNVIGNNTNVVDSVDSHRLVTSATVGHEESTSTSPSAKPSRPPADQHQFQSTDNCLGIGSSAHSLSPSSISSSVASKTAPAPSYTTTATAVTEREKHSHSHHHHPSPQHRNNQQQQHQQPREQQQQQQHPLFPKDHHHYPHHFQNQHHHLRTNQHLQHHQNQGQYSAPTSPAVKRKLYNQGVVAEIKTGRSFDDSTQSLSSSSSPGTSTSSLSPPSSSTSSYIGHGSFSPSSSPRPIPPETKPFNHQRNPLTYSSNQPPKQQDQHQKQQQGKFPSQPIYNTPVNREQSRNHHPDHPSTSPLLNKQQHHHQQQQPHLPYPTPQSHSTNPTQSKIPSFSPSLSTQLGQQDAASPPINEPPPKAPDLSVLISELLSVVPSSCDPSPTSPTSYTDFARSENVSSASPKSTVSKTSTTASQTLDSSSNSSVPGSIEVLEKAKNFTKFSSTSTSSHYQTPPSSTSLSSSSSSSPSIKKFYQQSHSESSPKSSHINDSRLVGCGDSSPGHASSGSGSANARLRCSFSPEHDYEPIENIQVDIPTSPRPEPKFPHPRVQQKKTKMAEVGGAAQPKHVKALHNFKGSNNDELCFKKGDIITVTQCLEGGWWEGTLNGRTGWFPSNYAKEVRADISLKSNKSGDVPVYKRESMQLYHNVVLKNVIETEKTHVSELIKVLQSYIKPIEGANLLSSPEYKLLVGNLEEVIAFQQTFLSALEECEKLPSSQRRIGGVFMQFAPDMKEIYSLYCANHPRSVSVLQTKRDELSKFVESVGASTPGAQTLTTILSKPFTRLDKYPSLLKELERHVEESHPDRGDTQRAIAVYKNIANSCSEIRKMKEMEHEIITSTIQGWEGEDISKLGEVLHLSQVKLHTQTGEKFERIFLLFQSCLVMLSMSTRLSSYQYEGNVPLSGLSSATLVESGDCFEIHGPMIEKITVSCGSKSEASTWMELLNNLVSNSGQPSSAKPQPLQVHQISTCQPSVSVVTSAKTAQISSTTASPPTSAPPSNTAPAPPSSQNPLVAAKTSCVWSLTCLRPSPPLRPSLMCRDEVLKSPRAVRKSTQKRKPDDPKVYNEDAFILQVIEAYCNSVKTRHTVNSCRIELPPDTNKKKMIEAIGSGKVTAKAILNSPQILLAEEEKIFDESEQQERTVVDTVYALQDRVKDLEQEQRKMRTDLDEERRCRRKLEMLVRGQVIKSGIIDVGSGGGETNAA